MSGPSVKPKKPRQKRVRRVRVDATTQCGGWIRIYQDMKKSESERVRVIQEMEKRDGSRVQKLLKLYKTTLSPSDYERKRMEYYESLYYPTTVGSGAGYPTQSQIGRHRTYRTQLRSETLSNRIVSTPSQTAVNSPVIDIIPPRSNGFDVEEDDRVATPSPMLLISLSSTNLSSKEPLSNPSWQSLPQDNDRYTSRTSKSSCSRPQHDPVRSYIGTPSHQIASGSQDKTRYL